MFELLKLELWEMVLPLVRDIIVTLVAIVAMAAWRWWKKLAMDAWIKDLVEDGVLLAQERFWNHVGAERFEKAKEFIVGKLNEYGVKVDMDWLEGLIDATVKRLRADYDGAWYRDE